MVNKIAPKSRLSVLAGQALIVGACVVAAPAALAASAQTSAPDGAGYLLSYNGSNYQDSSGSAGGVGSFSSDSTVPEPATWGMFGLGLAMIGMGAASRRRTARRS